MLGSHISQTDILCTVSSLDVLFGALYKAVSCWYHRTDGGAEVATTVR